MILIAGMLTAADAVQANQATANPDSNPQTSQNKVVKKHFKLPVIGRASWYGQYFQGKKTASGEPYNMYDLTAASKTLPLNSYAKVTNLRNNRWIVVRINDRGPMDEGRIIDLSFGAAEALHLTKAGVQTVKIQPVAADSTELVAMLDHQ